MQVAAKDFFASEGKPVDLAAESAFFAKLKMRNGTFKLTRPSRFRKIETVIGPCIAERAARISNVVDIGVSTGITTIEFARFLESCGVTARVTGTDLFVEAHLVKLARGITVLSDGTGWPLQYEIFGTLFRPWVRRLDYVTLAFAPLMLARAALQPRLKSMIDRGLSQQVQMITRAVAHNVTFVEDDVLVHSKSLVGTFDFARAANILNLNYFGTEEIVKALENIRSYLRCDGSLLLVTRTDKAGQNAGTLFELLRNGRFRVVTRIAEGSEIEQHVLALAAFKRSSPTTAGVAPG